MKQNLLKTWLMLVCLIVGVGTTWAETFSSKEGLTASWTSTATVGSYSSGATGYNGVQFGSKNTPAGTFTLTSKSSFSNVESVTIKASTGGTASIVSVTVGGAALTAPAKTSITSGTANKNQSFVFTGNGTKSGAIVITFSASDKAMYVGAIDIVEGSGDPTPEPTKYNVNIDGGITNGTVTASPTSAAEGATVTLTATPSTGYEFGSWNVTNASTSAAITVTDNKFTMPAANVNVSATFTEVVSLTTMDEIFAAATAASSTATDVTVTFSNWVVSGVKGNNAYVTDNAGKGFIVYGSGHGFVVGDILSGTASCKVQLYRGSAELTNLTSSTTGLTVTKGGTITPVTSLVLASLSGVNTGAVLSYERLQYDGTNFTDGETNLKPYNTFVTLPTLISGKNYDVTGVYIQYDATKEIAPRTAEDIELNEVINKYAVTFDATENGTIVVKDGETVINEGDEVAEGTELTIECTPANADYRFKNWQYKVGEGSWNTRQTNPQDYTMPSANVQFRANFELIPTYTVAWSVNGTEVKSENLKEGAAVVAPADPEDVNGKKFQGWVTTPIDGALNVAPEYVTPTATAEANVTYYAVFATLVNSIEASLTKLNGGSTLNAGDNIVVIAQSGENYYGMYQETISSSYVNYFVLDHEPTLTDINDDVKKSWTLHASNNGTWKLGDDTNGYLQNSTNNLYVGGESLSNGTAVTIAWNNTESKFTIKNDSRWIGCRADLTGDNQYKFRGAGNQSSPTTNSVCYLDIYRFVEGSTTYSDYCTTTYGTLNFVAQNEDGYWATFSSDKVTFFTDDVMVSAVGVENGELYMFSNGDAFDEDIVEIDGEDVVGYYVPANTGVLVYSTTPTTKYYYASDVTPSDDVAAVNMLRPASVAKEATGYKFYKLAYGDEALTPSTLGFYWGAADGAAFVSREGSAYLAVPTSFGAAVRGFAFNGGEATAISEVKSEELRVKNLNYYNLNGQRINGSVKGIVIVNGKKVLK